MSLRIRPKIAIIKELKIPQEKIDRFNELYGKHFGVKATLMKRIIGFGPCVECEDFPTVELSWQVGDETQSITRVERYCRSCVN